MNNIVFDSKKEYTPMGTAGRVPLNPWDVTCAGCETEKAFSMNNGGKNGVLIVDRIGVRDSDMYTCDNCGAELYDVAQYMDALNGWSTLESQKYHYSKDIRYVDIDQIDLLQRMVNMVDVTQPSQRLSTVSLMLAGVWDILDKMLKQAIMEGDINQYDCNTLMTKSVELRDLVHKAIDLVNG